jgi:uncharacterized membrane protein YphA (DoxX/SURF4 family)
MTVASMVGWVCQAALGVTFLVAGVSKLRDLPGLRAGVSAYGVVPDRWSWPAAVLVPAVEVVAGLALLTGVGGKLAAATVLVLLAVFMVATVTVLRRGDEVPCMCYGASSREEVSAATVVRLGALAVLATTVLLVPATSLSAIALEPKAFVSLISSAVAVLMLLWLLPPGLLMLGMMREIRRERATALGGQAAR